MGRRLNLKLEDLGFRLGIQRLEEKGLVAAVNFASSCCFQKVSRNIEGTPNTPQALSSEEPAAISNGQSRVGDEHMRACCGTWSSSETAASLPSRV